MTTTPSPETTTAEVTAEVTTASTAAEAMVEATVETTVEASDEAAGQAATTSSKTDSKAPEATGQGQQAYYETMYILRPDIPENEVEGHVGKYREVIIKSDGGVIDTQMRGKRRLAYPIGKYIEGIYVQLHHSGDGQQVSVLERAMRLSDDVIRYLTVKLSVAPVPRGERERVTSDSASSS